MSISKIRDKNHIIGEEAIRFLQNNIFPAEWVIRSIHPDYGLDLEVELFDYEEGKCITLGEHLYLQVKGTEHPQYGTCKVKDKVINVIKFKLEVAELGLVERMGSAYPILLILVDLVNESVYQICLNDYIRKVLPIQNPQYRKQKTVLINIPIENYISTENTEALKWYGKRTKIYSMFHEMLADIEDFNYMDTKQLIEYGKLFVEHYRNYDVLNCKNYWHGLIQIKSLLDDLYENDYKTDESICFVQAAFGLCLV